MPLTITQPRKVGRPQAAPRTIRILPSGYIRLSPDLCTADSFEVSVKTQCLFIHPQGSLALRYSSPYAKSGLLAARSRFDSVGVDPKEIAGEYVVRFIQGGFHITWATVCGKTNE